MQEQESKTIVGFLSDGVHGALSYGGADGSRWDRIQNLNPNVNFVIIFNEGKKYLKCTK